MKDGARNKRERYVAELSILRGDGLHLAGLAWRLGTGPG